MTFLAPPRDSEDRSSPPPSQPEPGWGLQFASAVGGFGPEASGRLRGTDPTSFSMEKHICPTSAQELKPTASMLQPSQQNVFLHLQPHQNEKTATAKKRTR